MTLSRFFGLALRVALLVLLVGFIGAWLTGSLRFNLGIGNWNVQLNSAADTSVSAKRSDPACLQAEAGMKMLAKPAAHAIRVRNPNTGKCSWEH